MFAPTQESSDGGHVSRRLGPVPGEPHGPGEGPDADGGETRSGGKGTQVRANHVPHNGVQLW